MKVHRVIQSYKDEWETHPDFGMVKVRRTVMQASNDETLVHGGKTYRAGTDGAFEVPAEVGSFLVTRAGWHTGPSPFATEKQRRVAEV